MKDCTKSSQQCFLRHRKEGPWAALRSSPLQTMHRDTITRGCQACQGPGHRWLSAESVLWSMIATLVDSTPKHSSVAAQVPRTNHWALESLYSTSVITRMGAIPLAREGRQAREKWTTKEEPEAGLFGGFTWNQVLWITYLFKMGPASYNLK